MDTADRTAEGIPEMSHANPDVLAFYRELPFNVTENPRAMAEEIRRKDHVGAYPVLLPLLERGKPVLEIGCGAGWLSNALAHHHGVAVTGVDFNPVAIETATTVAAELNNGARFLVNDLFAYAQPHPLVISLGVLHHTNDCLAAIRHLTRHCLEPDGLFFLGLYHRFGRKPFLDHFEKLGHSGASEDECFAEYRRLHPETLDETHARSWFRDQVLHPHETQHTLAELLPVFREEGLALMSTSLNDFQPVNDIRQVLMRERAEGLTARQKLDEGRYYPGFFLVLARKTDQSSV